MPFRPVWKYGYHNVCRICGAETFTPMPIEGHNWCFNCKKTAGIKSRPMPFKINSGVILKTGDERRTRKDRFPLGVEELAHKAHDESARIVEQQAASLDKRIADRIRGRR